MEFATNQLVLDAVFEDFQKTIVVFENEVYVVPTGTTPKKHLKNIKKRNSPKSTGCLSFFGFK
jgi:hypothetical protein